MALSLSCSKPSCCVILSEHCLYLLCVFSWEQHCLAAGRAIFHVLSSFRTCKMRGLPEIRGFQTIFCKGLEFCGGALGVTIGAMGR